MSSVFSIIFMTLFMFAGIAVVAAIVYLIVRLTRSNNDEKKERANKFSATLLFKIYLYVMSFITLLVSVYGGAMLLKTGASYIFGLPFSYDVYSVNTVQDPTTGAVIQCYNGDQEINFRGENGCVDNNEREQDLISGASLVVTMVILFAVHQIALRRMNRKELTKWLDKTYNFAGLIMYGLLGVVLIPVAIYQLTASVIYQPVDFVNYSAPGTAIAFLIMAVPLWIYFLLKVTRVKEAD